jgi:O-antigen ligase
MIIQFKTLIFYILILGILFIEIYSRALIQLLGLNFILYLDDVLVLVLLLIVILSFFSGKKFQQGLLSIPLILFSIVFIFSAVWNQVSIDIALLQFRSYLLMIGLYFFIIWGSSNKREIMKVFKWMILLSIPIVISVFYEFFTESIILFSTTRYGHEITSGGLFRAYSLVGNPIDFANYSIFILAIIIASLYEKFYLIGSRLTTAIFLLVVFTALVLSSTRGPVLALMIAMFFYFLFISKVNKFKALLMLILVLGALVFLGDFLLQRFAFLFSDSFAGSSYRVLYLLKTFEIFRDNPFLGVCPGMYGGWVSINYQLSPVYDQYNFSTDGISSIDMFFPHLIGELGLLGFVAYILFLVVPFVFFIKSYKTSIKVDQKFISLLMLLIIIMISVVGWLSISMETQLIQALYMVLLALSERYVKKEGRYK